MTPLAQPAQYSVLMGEGSFILLVPITCLRHLHHHTDDAGPVSLCHGHVPCSGHPHTAGMSTGLTSCHLFLQELMVQVSLLPCPYLGLLISAPFQEKLLK